MEESGPTQVDQTLCKMILNSVEEGDLSKIQANLEKYSLDIKALKDTIKGQNAFFMAALIKDDSQALEIFKYLKSKEVDPSLKDKLEQTCLYYTFREGKNLCCEYLVKECGLNVNEIDIYGQTPIYYCVRDNKIETVKLMIELGTNINIEDKYGQTCLFYAIREAHSEIVELLIQKGANVNQVDKKKRTPYSYAEKYNLQNICDLLLQNGANKPISKINAEKKEEKLTEFFTDQKVKMNIVLTNQLNEDIIIKDIIIKLNEEILGEKNKEIKLKCPTKDIIDSESLPVEIKNQILKIIRMADYNIPFETNFNGEFKGSVGKFILKWTTPSLLNYENGKLETTNESIIDFPDLAITSPKLKFNYNTFNNENNEVLLNINIANVSNKSVKINFIIESGKEIEFIVSGVTKQVHNINANEFKNLIFRLIPLIRNDELKLPTIKIIEKDSESLEKICSYYYLLDKIYTI